MKNKLTTCCLLMLFPFLAFSQEMDFWTSVSSKPAQDQRLESFMEMSEYQTLGLEIDNFKNYVKQSPFRGTGVDSQVLVDFPDAKGGMKNFKLYQTHTMSPGLAVKFPSISTYIGTTNDKKNTIRLTITNQGVFGVILGEGSDVYINPMTKSGTIYQVFERKNAHRTGEMMQCLVESVGADGILTKNTAQGMPDDGKLRTYELAVATTGEYSQFHINQAGVGGGTDAQKKVAVMDAIVVTMNRVNGIYERDLAITMTLIPDNDDLIFLNGGTDPFTNNNASAVLSQSQTTIDNIIGFSNYDIGHTFTTASGGIAQLNSPCTGQKARGTTGISAPVGDFFDVDFVAHEMGHQFGGNHTFNSSCGGNRNNATAVEPGSGSTIMAYAGVCSPSVQNHSDPYFHITSISEITANITSGASSSCDDESFISNSAPVLSSLSSHTIPFGTAFVLTASATDADGDALTYCWEQSDTELAPMPPSPNSTQGPLFRSFDPDPSPSRYFPKMSNIVNGNLTPMWEVIPNVARSMTFFVTVRDNNLMGGQNDFGVVLLNVANTGPFVVTSQNSNGVQLDPGESFQVTWDVAGTTGNGINAANVDILLSYDAGFTYPEVLANDVPNDGSHTVITPSGAGSSICRIMVKASDNVFFDINDSFIQVMASVDEFSEQFFSVVPNPNKGEFSLSFERAISNDLTAKIFDIQGRLISTHEIKAGSGSLKTIKMNNPQTGFYLIQISDKTRTSTKKLIVK